MKKLSLYLSFLLALVLMACSNDTKFKIEGEVAGNRTMNLRIIYFGNDNINSVLTAARDGKFVFEGSVPKGTIVEIFDNDYRVMGRLFAENGDKLKVKIDPKSPYACEVDGNEISQRWCKWNAENATTLNSRNSAAINALISKYVKAHKDDILSTLLLISCYDASLNPAEATQLMASINKEARLLAPVDAWTAGNAHVRDVSVKAKVLPIRYMDDKDSIRSFSVKSKRLSLLAFSDRKSGRRDSIIPAIRRMRKRVNLLDMSTDIDTMAWRRSAREDSVEWSTAWVAGNVAAPGVDRLGVSSIPYFIVADSTGQQIYRGRSIKRAEAVVDSILKK